jgi:hypothetical protein
VFMCDVQLYQNLAMVLSKAELSCPGLFLCSTWQRAFVCGMDADVALVYAGIHEHCQGKDCRPHSGLIPNFYRHWILVAESGLVTVSDLVAMLGSASTYWLVQLIA